MSAWPIAAQTASTVRAAALRSRCLSLAKTYSIGVQVGRVFWQEEEFGADRADELANCLAPVAAEVIQDDDFAGSKDGQENLLNIGAKAHAIERPFDEPLRIGLGPPGRSWSSSGREEPWREVCVRAALILARAPYRSWSKSRR